MTERQGVETMEQPLIWGSGATRVTNPEDVKCLWKLGYRSIVDAGNNEVETLHRYLDEVEKYGDVYLELSNPHL